MRNVLSIKSKYQQENLKKILSLSLFVILMLMCMHVFADDLLKDTDKNLIDTINGTGKKYLYIGEFVVACFLWLQSRSAKVFFGVLILSIGANIILKMGGII